MAEPSLAAVVLNYNYREYVLDALASLARQTVPFDEVFLVDDGSTDDSLAVVADALGGVTLIAKENGGQLSACRAALEATSCEYVYFLDADDMADPTLAQTVRAALVDEPVKVQFQLRGVDRAGAPLSSIFPGYPAGYDARRMVDDNFYGGFYLCAPTSGNVFRVDALRALPLDQVDGRDFIDGPPALVLPYRGEIVSLSRPLASYRVHGGNHSEWDRPSAELLEKEIAWFHERWAQARTLDGDARHGPGVAYVAERRLYVEAITGRGALVDPTAAYLRALWRTHTGLPQKLLLTGIALGLQVPSSRVRNALVRARRSPLNRPRLANRVLALPRRWRAARQSVGTP